MSTWAGFIANRKILTIHAAICVAFLLFIFFGAEPVFEQIEHIPGNSKLVNISINDASGNVVYLIEEVFITPTVSVVNGWAFIEGIDSGNNATYLVLKSSNKTYVFSTEVIKRNDITQQFKDREINFNYDSSGFSAKVAHDKIPDGEFNLGIYIANRDNPALKYTDIIVTKSKGSVTRSK